MVWARSGLVYAVLAWHCGVDMAGLAMAWAEHGLG